MFDKFLYESCGRANRNVEMLVSNGGNQYIYERIGLYTTMLEENYLLFEEPDSVFDDCVARAIMRHWHDEMTMPNQFGTEMLREYEKRMFDKFMEKFHFCEEALKFEGIDYD